MKWYQEWQQNARNRYLEGYYPGHKRVPNPIVLSLYGIGYFFGDFVPLILNLINGIYWAIKRLVAFVVGLLIEASIFIVLAGSVVFSVFHSIDRMRVAGATGGLEYVGVLMFEVIFIGSAATLTGFLMKKKLPRGFIEWLGLSFTILGFFVGLAFVWWSNFQGMAPTIEGRIIGSAVPILVLIGEGVLAYRFIVENKEEVSLQELIRRNQLSTDEVKSLIEDHVKKQREKAALKHKETPPVVEEKKPITEKKKWWKNWFKKKPKTKTILDDKNDSEVQEKADAQDVETGAETNAEMNTQSETKPDAEADVKMDVEMDTESPAQTDAQTDAKVDAQTGVEMDAKAGAEMDAKAGANTDASADTQGDAKASSASTTKTKKSSSKKASTKVPAKVKRWARQFRLEKGKLPGRVEIQKKFAEYGKSQCTKYAAQLKEELGDKAS